MFSKNINMFIFLSILSFAYAAPANDQDTQILKYDFNNDGLGRYNFAFETSDGTKRKEESELVNAGDPEKEKLIVRGEFQYIGPDGVTYTVTYIADEFGFHPQGDHLPALPQEPKVPQEPTLDVRFNDRRLP